MRIKDKVLKRISPQRKARIEAAIEDVFDANGDVKAGKEARAKKLSRLLE